MNLANLNIQQGNIQIEFVNSLGQSLYRKTLEFGSQLNIQLPEAASAKGLYYLFIRQTGEHPKQVTLPIMIQ